MNIALLTKWWWLLLSEGDSLWKAVVRQNNEISEDNGLTISDLRNPSPTWKLIGDCVLGPSPHAQVIRRAISTQMGNGNLIAFWTDPWMGDQPLMNLFPRLYSIASNNSAKISEMGELSDNRWKWILNWRRRLFDWEVQQVNELLAIIGDVVPRESVEDVVMWQGDCKGFSVKNCRRLLYNIQQEPNQSVSPFPNWWRWSAPSKLKILVWLACHSRLPSKEALWRRGIIAAQDLNCCRCDASNEDSDHCVLNCKKAWDVWSFLLRKWGCQWVQPRSMCDLVRQWEGLAVHAKAKKVWFLLLFQVGWGIWLDRNNGVFSATLKPSKEIVFDAVRHSMWWAKYNLQENVLTNSNCLASDNWCSFFSM